MKMPEELISEAAKIYKVLSNSTRIKILYYLHYHNDIPVNSIVTGLGYSQPVISKQLGILRRYQLVRTERHGNQIHYIFDDPHIVEMLDDMINHVKHEIKGKPHPKNLY